MEKRVIISAAERWEICAKNKRKNNNWTEYELKKEIIKILISQGYEYREDINNEEALKKQFKIPTRTVE